MKAGATVRAFDPAGMEEAKKSSQLDGLVYCENSYDTVQDADLLILMTEWNQFRNLDWDKLKDAMKGRIMVDLRNVYPPDMVREQGLEYYSVGRP